MSRPAPSPVIQKVLDAIEIMDQLRALHLERARNAEERQKAEAEYMAIMRILADILHEAEGEHASL